MVSLYFERQRIRSDGGGKEEQLCLRFSKSGFFLYLFVQLNTINSVLQIYYPGTQFLTQI